VRASAYTSLSGVLTATYYCEAQPRLTELSIVGESVTVTGGTGLPMDLTGSLTEQAAGRYTVSFDNDGEQPGFLIFDQDAQYATFVSDSSPVAGNRQGYVGLLQKSPLQDVSYTEADLVGSWSGVAARVDAGYSVTDSYEITAEVTAPDGLALSGQDGDGSFSASASGIILQSDSQQNPYPGLYVSGWSSANQVIWPDLGQSGGYHALYALS
jgi:hypothetical protein